MSSDGAMHYNFGAIEAARSDISTTNANLNSQLGDLKNFLQPLVATWEGDGFEAYQAQQAKWDAAANDLNQVLHAIAQAVGAGNDAMSETNRMAARSWQQ